jgi:integrase/recombinase XerD
MAEDPMLFAEIHRRLHPELHHLVDEQDQEDDDTGEAETSGGSGGQGEATEYRKLSALRSFFKYLKLTKAVTEDPTEMVQAPKVEPKFSSKVLDVDEIKAMIAAASAMPADALLLRMLYVTGGRISEVLALTWADFKATDDGGANLQIFGKGRHTRVVYIGTELWNDLLAFRGDIGDDEPLFTINRHQAARIIARLAKMAKVNKPVTPHAYRHSLASHLLSDGATLAQVRDQLGHADIKTTSLYLHAEDRTQMIRELRIK